MISLADFCVYVAVAALWLGVKMAQHYWVAMFLAFSIWMATLPYLYALSPVYWSMVLLVRAVFLSGHLTWLLCVFLFARVPTLAEAGIPDWVSSTTPSPETTTEKMYRVVLGYNVFEMVGVVVMFVVSAYLAVFVGGHVLVWMRLGLLWVLGKLQRFFVSAGAERLANDLGDAADQYLVEKVMPGSVFMPAVASPKYQASVYTIRGVAPRVYAGQGFLAPRQLFVTAYHVIDGADYVVIVTEKGELTLKKSDFQHKEGDIAFAPLANDGASRLGLSVCRLKHNATVPNSGLYVVAQARDKKSMGLLNPHSAFGIVTYEGSTQAGFSGAPYYVHNTVYGMHIGGASSNIGYEGAYIAMLLNQYAEDSEDYLVQSAQDGVEFEYEQNPYTPDEYRVKMDGRYIMVGEGTLDKMLRVGEGRQKRVRLRDVDYDAELALGQASDPIPEEELPLAPRGAVVFADSENLESPHPGVDVGALGQRPVQGIDVPYRNRVDQLNPELSSRTVGLPATDGPPLMRAQQNEVSPSTLTVTYERETQANLPRTLRRRRYRRRLQGLIEVGRRISRPQPT